MLAFDRIAGKWCIGVLVRGDMKPLLNASRATRIAAAPLMTALLSVMVAEAEKISADTLNAKASIDEALEHIRALKEER